MQLYGDGFDQVLSFSKGRLTMNSDPCPGVLSTWMSPPWAWTILLAMARPRPVEHSFPVGLAAPRWNSEKSFSCSAAEIPGP